MSTYGAIAAYLGAKKSSRMVGWAMNQCHAMPHIPAHRVVNRNGLLTGKMHFEHPFAMQERLEAENIQVVNDQVKDFENLFWDPNVELNLLLS